MYDDPTPPWEAWYNQSPFLHSLYTIGLVAFCSVIAYYIGRELIKKQEEKRSADPSFKGIKLEEAQWRKLVWIFGAICFIYLQSFHKKHYEDGVYCAKVKYYNPETGTISKFFASVEVEDDRLTTIYFDSGGHLDDFTPSKFSYSGFTTVIDDRDYEYTVGNLVEGECEEATHDE